MKTRLLIDAIGHIDDQLIEAYDQTTGQWQANEGQKTPAPRRRLQHKSRSHIWRNRAIAAACFCLVAVGGLYAAFNSGLLNLGGASGGAGAGGTITVPVDPTEPNGDTITAPTYMYYDGPILPLTLLEQTDGITARRNIIYDFSPYTDKTETYEADTKDGPVTEVYTSHQTSARVTDSYLLANKTDEDILVKAVYPFASSLHDLSESLPTITLDGSNIRTELTIGQYSGGFTSAYGAGQGDQDMQLNLAEIDSWLGYRQLLSDGSYLERAFSMNEHEDQAVTVYELTDFVINSGEGINPSLAVTYKAANNVQVLSYGFHGMENPGDGSFVQGFSLPDGRNLELPEQRFCLIVIGGDITDIELQGYQNLGFDSGTEMEISAQVTRSESTLKTITRELLTHHYSIYDSYNNFVKFSEQTTESISFDHLFDAVYDYMYTYGPLSSDSVERYQEGWLADVFGEVGRVDRIVYLVSEITIPSNSTVELNISLEQRGSHDFYEKSENIPGVTGYDLTTTLGSNMTFTSQEASIADHCLIEIVEQNFGFDLSSDVRDVPLSSKVDYYYMLVRKLIESD